MGMRAVSILYNGQIICTHAPEPRTIAFRTLLSLSAPSINSTCSRYAGENIAPCGNREGCMPVALYDDAEWHIVELSITPRINPAGTLESAEVRFSLDQGLYGGFGNIPYFRLPEPTYLGFSARTGGATNNHWFRSVTHTMPPPPPLRPQPIGGFSLSGSASVVGEIIELTQLAPSQTGTASMPLPYTAADIDSGIAVRFWLYVGGGTGADGLCINFGSSADLGGRNAEDGLAEGVSVCLDEWADGDEQSQDQGLHGGHGDHGITLSYNGNTMRRAASYCENREGCPPVSLFDNQKWCVRSLRGRRSQPTRALCPSPCVPSCGLCACARVYAGMRVQ